MLSALIAVVLIAGAFLAPPALPACAAISAQGNTSSFTPLVTINGDLHPFIPPQHKQSYLEVVPAVSSHPLKRCWNFLVLRDVREGLEHFLGKSRAGGDYWGIEV